MPKLEDYLQVSYPLQIVEDKEEGGFVASYPDLAGCITCGETIEETIVNAQDAKQLWIEAALKDGIKIPTPHARDNYSK